MGKSNIIFMASSGLLQATEVTDTESGDPINTATITASIFDGVTTTPASILAFTSGGVLAIAVGDTIEGATGGATATIQKVTLSSGHWAAGTAAGQLEITGQNGVFQAENLDTTTQANIATIPAGDSTGLGVVLLGAGQVKIPMTTIGLSTSDFIYIESTRNYNLQFDIDAIGAANIGYVTITAANVAETLTGLEVIYIGIINGKDIAFAHDAVGPPPDADGYYDAEQPDDLEAVYEGATYYIIEKIVYGGHTVRHRYLWDAGYYSNLDIT